MISRPSCAQLVEAVRRDLSESVTPAISDPPLLARLDMMDSVLRHVQARCEGEVHWMRCEIADIEALAIAVSQEFDRSSVGQALDRLRANRAATDLNADVRIEYGFASEVLSCCLDVLVGTSSPLRERATGLLNARLERELDIRGIFETAGRR